VVTVPSLADALTLCAEFSPEHVSLQGAGAEQVRDRVRRAGAVFCGASSPVSIGDYIAGPNHTLPTQGSARYGSPLGVADFMRTPSVVQLSQEEFAALAPAAVVLAEAEGLPGHAAALRARLASRSGAS
jgi:histidinol dehydrogenase